MAKRYYWLKLSEDFFGETYIKALRKLPSGDSLVIVYLKMQLKSLKTEGMLKYCGLLPDSVAELALSLDEDENIVRLTIEALLRFRLIGRWEDETLYIAAMQELIGSEGSSAERVRKHRQLRKEALSAASDAQCDLEDSEKALHCNGEIEIELEKDKEIEQEQEIEKDPPPKSPAADDTAAAAEATQPKQKEKIMQERFERFWAAYPKKQGEGGAKSTWRKLAPSEEQTESILRGLEKAKRSAQWQREGGRYIPQAEKWLNREQWKDEYPAEDWRGGDGLGRPSYDLDEINRLLLDSAVHRGREQERGTEPPV